MCRQSRVRPIRVVASRNCRLRPPDPHVQTAWRKRREAIIHSTHYRVPHGVGGRIAEPAVVSGLVRNRIDGGCVPTCRIRYDTELWTIYPGGSWAQSIEGAVFPRETGLAHRTTKAQLATRECETSLAEFVDALDAVFPPKQRHTAGSPATTRYYAGFSERFVEDLLSRPDALPSGTVLDPWMGSGTTVRVAHQLGHRAVGVDLNPAMVAVAKARLLSKGEEESATKALQLLMRTPTPRARVSPEDPLLQWFEVATTRVLRGVACRALSVLDGMGLPPGSMRLIESLSAIDAHVLSSVFLMVRRLLMPFIGSNPTWVKHAANGSRQQASWSQLREALQRASDDLLGEALEPIARTADVELRIGSSLSLPDAANTADWAVSSPPYCTRIDYAVASRPELAVLGMHSGAQDALRREMLGTTTVPRTVAVSPREIGDEAASVLHAVSHHTAKASATYYRKWIAQYYEGLARSLDQLSALDKLAILVLVVQDSHYKEIRIDLASTMVEMCTMRGWALAARRDFTVSKTKATINPGTRKYRKTFDAMESVLVLGREPSRKDGGAK